MAKIQELQVVLDTKADARCAAVVDKLFTDFTSAIPSQVLYDLSFGPPPGGGNARLNGFAALQELKTRTLAALREQYRAEELQTFLTELDTMKRQVFEQQDRIADLEATTVKS